MRQLRLFQQSPRRECLSPRTPNAHQSFHSLAYNNCRIVSDSIHRPRPVSIPNAHVILKFGYSTRGHFYRCVLTDDVGFGTVKRKYTLAIFMNKGSVFDEEYCQMAMILFDLGCPRYRVAFLYSQHRRIIAISQSIRGRTLRRIYRHMKIRDWWTTGRS